MRRIGFLALPAEPHYWLADTRAPACLVEGPPLGEGLGPPDGDGIVRLDIEIKDGRVARLAPLGTAPAGAANLRGGMVLPGFVDAHTHLDKGHIWPRAANPDGSFYGAVTATAADRETRWAAPDVQARMEFGLAASYAQGTVAVRTHLDSHAAQAPISWSVFRRVRDAWAGRIELQASSIAPMDIFETEDGERLADIVAESGGILGVVTRLSGGVHEDLPPSFMALLDRVFLAAKARDLDLDLHVDESGESGARALGEIARAALRHGFQGKLQCGHCCSLAVQPADFVERTLDDCRAAGIDVVSLPMCNMYLQDRKPGRTPRWRGVTLLHEMTAYGINVSVASDNCRDPFYAYGDHDMVEVFTQAVRIAHLDRPFGSWYRVVTRNPALAMRLAERGVLKEGAAADLVLFRARYMSELLSRHQGDRVVLRRGRAIDTSLPDYRELDGLMNGAA